MTGAVTVWLRELYPPDADSGPGAMRPDRLAELHVTRELASSPALARACLTNLDPAQARNALVLLTRASGEHPAARKLLESAIAGFADVVADLAASRTVMITIANTIPYPSLALAPAHATLSKRILQTCSEDSALWLNTLSVLLSSLGRREEALTAINDAVAIHRKLAAARPAVFADRLASSLEVEASVLPDLRQVAEAQELRDEASVIRDLM